MVKVLAAVLLVAALACAKTTRAPEPPKPPENPHACATQCEDELRACMGNTLEDSRYSTCMFENDSCVMSCYDIT